MYKAIIDDKTISVLVEKDKVYLEQNEMDLDMIEVSEGYMHVLSQNKSFIAEVVTVDRESKIVKVKVNNTVYEVAVKDKMDELLEKLGMDSIKRSKTEDLKAPMPGLILEIGVEKDQKVSKGDKLIILEAMKMENVIKASGDGVVKEITVKVGDSVENGEALIIFE